jgi:hypothetical protein
LHAFVITVGGESFELSEGISGDLSEHVEAAIPAAIEAIRASLVCVETAMLQSEVSNFVTIGGAPPGSK